MKKLRRDKVMTGQQIANARDAWFRSEDGKTCSQGTATGQYLNNRLERAFLAGVVAALDFRAVDIARKELR